MNFPCCVEYAKSKRSTCKSCGRTITKGSIRIGKQFSKDHDGYYFYHPHCFRAFPANLKAEDLFFGFETLAEGDKNAVRLALEGEGNETERNAAKKEVGRGLRKKETPVGSEKRYPHQNEKDLVSTKALVVSPIQRAQRAAAEAFEISGDEEELLDTMAIISGCSDNLSC